MNRYVIFLKREKIRGGKKNEMSLEFFRIMRECKKKEREKDIIFVIIGI